MDKCLIYQMLPRLWGNTNRKCVQNGTLEQNGCGRFADIDNKSLDYIKGLGMDYVWFTGVIRHSTKESTRGCVASHPQFVKGRAGSPYAICDYYDVNPYLATDPDKRMSEFENLIKRTHKKDLKVLIDFVPNHVARDYGSFRSPYAPADTQYLGTEDDMTAHWKPENDFFYYPGEALTLPNNQQFKEQNPTLDLYHEFPAKASGNVYSPSPSVNDWYETIRINYCDFYTETWNKMYQIVRFWASKGVDGFRCDMVELVPWQFFKWMIAKIKEEFPSVIFVAEVYDKNLYSHYALEVGFDLLYDKSGLYDVIFAITKGWQSTKAITWNWQSIPDNVQSHLLNFLENHDELRFGSSDFGQDARRTFAALYVSLYFNKSPFMVYFGEEYGERGMDDEGFSGRNGRTTIFDWWSVDSLRAIKKGASEAQDKFFDKFSAALKRASVDEAIKNGKTFDLCWFNSGSEGFDHDKHFAFLRGEYGDIRLFVSNFSDKDADIKVSIPSEAFEYMKMPSSIPTSIAVHVPAYDGVILSL
ncbi:MAG: alpha-amylase family glycosyl hydrolase [Bacteroidales bacterium]|nr:alpha-amylase family glycosyl hydrolase [Bacteroidales bacterium]